MITPDQPDRSSHVRDMFSPPWTDQPYSQSMVVFAPVASDLMEAAANGEDLEAIHAGYDSFLFGTPAPIEVPTPLPQKTRFERAANFILDVASNLDPRNYL